jgi:putative FmdB family regulatory protein
MPLYEYKCPKCGRRFEEIVTLSRADEVVCESCGYEKPERLMSTFATGFASAGSSVGSSSSCSSGSSGFS